MPPAPYLQGLRLRPGAIPANPPFPLNLPFVENLDITFSTPVTFPNATILSFDGGEIASVRLQETSHFQITKGILDAPGRYWQELLRDDEPECP
jgi:hypothetical protein